METKHCTNCNQINLIHAKFCEKCGTSFDNPNTVPQAEKSNSSWLVLLLLSYFLGWLGIDRFYVGKIGTGILKLVTLGGCFVWYYIDLILIGFERLKDKHGMYVVDREMSPTSKLIIIITLIVFYFLVNVLPYIIFKDYFNDFMQNVMNTL